MSTHFRFSLLATVVIVSVSTAVAMKAPRVLPPGHACLAVGEGVCFSGSTQWVAQAAETLSLQQTEMKVMIADAS